MLVRKYRPTLTARWLGPGDGWHGPTAKRFPLDQQIPLSITGRHPLPHSQVQSAIPHLRRSTGRARSLHVTTPPPPWMVTFRRVERCSGVVRCVVSCRVARLLDSGWRDRVRMWTSCRSRTGGHTRDAIYALHPPVTRNERKKQNNNRSREHPKRRKQLGRGRENRKNYPKLE